MQQNTLAILMICGLAMLSGCNTSATSRAADQPKAITPDVVTEDAAVLQVVFDDMLNKDDDESPMEWHGDQSRVVYVSKKTPEWRPEIDEVLSRIDQEKWNALTSAQRGAASEAADDLVARADPGKSLPEPRSTSGRLKVYEDGGAATQPTRKNFFEGEPGSSVFLPGYSKEGRYAVVRLIFSWSIHSGVATYIMERTQGGWKVLLRNFTYYV